jgi:hypothetical protein
MTTVERPANIIKHTKEQSKMLPLTLQDQKWPLQSPSKANQAPAQPSLTSNASLNDSSMQQSISLVPVPSERTPICRFFKHGELIRKATLSKARKRKSAPVHKKEIFGSPFHSDYFAKPLATGLSSERLSSGDVLGNDCI